MVETSRAGEVFWRRGFLKSAPATAGSETESIMRTGEPAIEIVASMNSKNSSPPYSRSYSPWEKHNARTHLTGEFNQRKPIKDAGLTRNHAPAEKNGCRSHDDACNNQNAAKNNAGSQKHGKDARGFVQLLMLGTAIKNNENYQNRD
jgi:hypothetical protein